jgi:hypothetical protein
MMELKEELKVYHN